MPDPINVSLRECRLVIHRVLWQAGAPHGTIPPISDVVVAAEAAGLGGLAALRDDADVLGATASRPARPTVHGHTVTVDLGGKHAFAAAPDILDLAVAVTRRRGRADVEVSSVTRPELLAVLATIAADHAVAIDGRAPHRSDRLVFHPLRSPDAGPGLPSAVPILRRGADVDPDLWWELFHLGNNALTPDSAVSRRHTGRSVFDEHGRIVGEIGEDANAHTAAATPASAGGGVPAG